MKKNRESGRKPDPMYTTNSVLGPMREQVLPFRLIQ